MADQGGQTESTGTGTDAGGEAAAPDPIAKLTESFETFQKDVTSRFDAMASQKQDGEPDDEHDDDEPDLPELEFEFEQDDFNEQGELSQEAQMREFGRMMRSIAREELAPLQAEREQDRRVQEADALEERYPKLRDEKYQDEIVQKTVDAAKALGKPELAREPKFLEMVFLQENPPGAAGEEIPAGSTTGATLERGGGAPPAEGKSSTDEEGDRIVNVSRSQRFRLGTKT